MSQDRLDADQLPETQLPAMTSIEVLQAVGINFPTNPQCKECAGILRELFDESKKINGKVGQAPINGAMIAGSADDKAARPKGW